ncbi:SRPBCC domain-containing protein [Brachybacterium halotolerans subsp. kimchii]|uniref:SRPBCC family protein n=1 Tax=Brachybacterium halotolerans TaxID=2795215 RepID=UPI001E641F94|nr:SRPBCC domain-containing protein [Brachybacterium halotolerans]UEJ81389.1 SRPBCC domain-containing protein [Brachybacterium halotolerans subsp. kimchii]
MTGTTDHGIEIDREIPAPSPAVFAAWTQPESFARWFGGPEVDVPQDGLDLVAEPGRAWRARMVLPDGASIDWIGEFLEVVPAQRLVLTISDRPEAESRARILVELSPEGAGTRMHFSQETPGFTTEQQEGVLAGWQAFLEELAREAIARA